MIQPPSAGVIGWPVAHSRSPLIHRFWLGKLGLDGDYGRFPVHPNRLGDAVRTLPVLGLRGVNVTVPHKVAVMAHLDRVDALAVKVGAVNTIVVEDGALVGYNSDVAGVVAALSGVNLAGVSILVIGAGGAARAAVAALDGSRAGEVLVVARDAGKALALTRPFDVVGVGVPFARLADTIASVEVLINASPLGMSGQCGFASEVLAAVGRCEAEMTVFDMVYAPLETPLLATACASGLRIVDGLSMLIGQAAAAFALFFGAPAPREHDAELRALLMAALAAKPL